MKLYTGIDIGTNSIKIVVLGKENNKFFLIDKDEEKTDGVKRGKIVNTKNVTMALDTVKKRLEEKLDVSINKAVICIPPEDIEFDIVSSKIDIKSDKISGDDISNIIIGAVRDKIDNENELITATPIGFKLDDGTLINDPKGLVSKSLSTKVVVTTIPRKNLYPLMNILELCEIQVIDMTFKPIGDYFEVRDDNLDSLVGAIINIGEDSTNISIYNKGIMIKSNTINVGSYHVDHDYSYIYDTGLAKSRMIKEEYSLASSKNATKYDDVELENEAGEKVIVNQLEASEVAEARIKEILKVAKNEIKNLTNRKISYIIVLGGLSEMIDFSQVATETLGSIARVWDSKTMGLRHNKYTSVAGTIKYFDDKLLLRGKSVEMFSSSDIDKIINKNNDSSIVNESFERFIN